MRGTLLHALLALAGLVFAYQTWTRVEDDETPIGEVLLADCSAQRFQSLTFKSESMTVTLTPEARPNGTEYWMTVERTQTEQPDAGVSEAPKTKRFLTNKKVEELLKLIYPLRANRDLGVPTAADLKGFGMDKINSTLTLDCGSTTTVEIGGSTFGSGDLYARRKGEEKLVLLEGRLSKDLQAAEFNFMQKALHGFVLKDVDEARITVNGATKRLLQRNRLVPEQATWVDSAQPDQRNELYDNWLTRLSRITAREYLATNATPGAELTPPIASVKEVAVIEYFVEGVSKGKLTIARAGDDMTHYYARSESTRNWVAISEIVGQQVERDAPVIVGLEEAPAPAATKTPTPDTAPTPTDHEPPPAIAAPPPASSP